MSNQELAVQQDKVVIQLTHARQALQQARTIQDFKLIVDVANAAKIFAKRQNLSKELIAEAASIEFTSLREMGLMLKETERNKGTKGQLKGDVPSGTKLSVGSTKAEPPTNNAPTLAELGITRKESSMAQAIAEIPIVEFIEKIAVGEKEILKASKEIRSKKANFIRSQRINKIVEISKANSILPVDTLYPLILCDPPWCYEHIETESRAIENQYPTMSLDELKALKIPSMQDCILFMWATSPKLAEAMELISFWGFSYRTCAVWDKEIIGMGYYFRQQHELLLVSTRGNLPTPEPANRPSSVIRSRREAHSKKPERAYQIIESMYSELSKLEMFSRYYRSGWVSWGNQSE